MQKYFLALALSIGASLPSQLLADQSPPINGFSTPSRNIHCELLKDDEIALRCDIIEISSATPPPPNDCEFDWGKAFIILPTSDQGQLICHSDTVWNDQHLILPYGQLWQSDGFTCNVTPNGLTCINAKGHGFALSRRTQVLF